MQRHERRKMEIARDADREVRQVNNMTKPTEKRRTGTAN